MNVASMPDDQIEQAAATATTIYYRLANQITVISRPSVKKQGWVFFCLSGTCPRTDGCVHTRRVRKYCGQPLSKEAA